jgi:hypothetical protein
MKGGSLKAEHGQATKTLSKTKTQGKKTVNIPKISYIGNNFEDCVN